MTAPREILADLQRRYYALLGDSGLPHWRELASAFDRICQLYGDAEPSFLLPRLLILAAPTYRKDLDTLKHSQRHYRLSELRDALYDVIHAYITHDKFTAQALLEVWFSEIDLWSHRNEPCMPLHETLVRCILCSSSIVSFDGCISITFTIDPTIPTRIQEKRHSWLHRTDVACVALHQWRQPPRDQQS